MIESPAMQSEQESTEGKPSPAPLTDKEKQDLRALDASFGTRILEDDADEVLSDPSLKDEIQATFSCSQCGIDLDATLDRKELQLIVDGSGKLGADKAIAELAAMNDAAHCQWFPEPNKGFRLWLRHGCPTDGRKNPKVLPLLKRSEAKRMVRLIDARRREVDRREMLQNPRLVFKLGPAED